MFEDPHISKCVIQLQETVNILKVSLPLPLLATLSGFALMSAISILI